MIKLLSQLNKREILIAGGKGASLGEMMNIGIMIPPGFVVLVSAFERFLQEADLDVEIEAIIKKVKPEDINSVNEASEKIRDLIRDARLPGDLIDDIYKSYANLEANYVAVRSSATAEDSLIASWAGELESYLNVTKKSLLSSIKKCWSSLFTPRAIFYRFEKNLADSKVSVAVVVQKMIQAEISGICFTVHPITEDKNQMIIEAGYGLGEAIVGGIITPDTYVVNKLDGLIEDKNVSEQEIMIMKTDGRTQKVKVAKDIIAKQKLSDEKILELTKLAIKIENYYKKPQDIEWAFWKNNFYILQSRPITTLKK